jgi:hypothetical protein
MKSKKMFKRWTLKKSDLIDLSPQKVRDLIIQCFSEAQKEAYRIARHNVGEKPATEEQLRKSMENFVKVAFLSTGGDFENPTVDNLSEAVEFLAKRADSWKTPKEIIDYNKGQILKLIEILKKRSNVCLSVSGRSIRSRR